MWPRKKGAGSRLGKDVTIRTASVAAQRKQARCQAELALMPFYASFSLDYRLFFGFRSDFLC
jgi:hypothetical protein